MAGHQLARTVHPRPRQWRQRDGDAAGWVMTRVCKVEELGCGGGEGVCDWLVGWLAGCWGDRKVQTSWCVLKRAMQQSKLCLCLHAGRAAGLAAVPRCDNSPAPHLGACTTTSTAVLKSPASGDTVRVALPVSSEMRPISSSSVWGMRIGDASPSSVILGRWWGGGQGQLG